MTKLISFFSIIILIAVGCGDTSDENQLNENAQEIHENVITIDTHVDINVDNFTAEQNYISDLNTQVNLPKMDEGGLDVVFFSVYTGQDSLTEEGYAAAYDNAKSKFDAIHRLTEEIAPDQIELALTSEDVRRIVSEGKKVAMIGVENAYPVGTDLSRIEEFYNMGARYMSLSHNGHSQFSDSNTGEEDDVWLYNGLSDLGKQAVAEMNRLGIMIDISHPSKEANMQTMQLSEAPVIASHSSARGMNDVSRNLDDEELMMLKENGGVAQATAFRSYLHTEKFEAHREASNKIIDEVAAEMDFERLDWDEVRNLDEAEREDYFAKWQEVQDSAAPRIESEVHSEYPPVDVGDFVDHIDYMVNLIGINHVGISSDFDGGGGVYGWDDASETMNVTLELVRRGYTEEQIAKLWGENLLRVLDEVQQVAEGIQSQGN